MQRLAEGRAKGKPKRPNPGQNDLCQLGTTNPLACRWRGFSVSILGEPMLPSIQAPESLWAGRRIESFPVLPRFPLARRSIPAQQSAGWVSPKDITALLTVPESVPSRFECTDPTEGSGKTQAPSYIRPKAQDGPTSSYKCPFSTRGATRASGVEQRVECLTKD